MSLAATYADISKNVKQLASKINKVGGKLLPTLGIEHPEENGDMLTATEEQMGIIHTVLYLNVQLEIIQTILEVVDLEVLEDLDRLLSKE